GGEGHAAPAFTALTELIWPILDLAAGLPQVFRETLDDVFGDRVNPVRGGPTLIQRAVSALLTAASSAAPVLVVLDDFDLFDADSRQVLAYVASRLINGSVRMLISARRRELLHGIDKSIQILDVEPLSDT